MDLKKKTLSVYGQNRVSKAFLLLCEKNINRGKAYLSDTAVHRSD